MPQRVEFSFDDRSLESLEKMERQGRVPSLPLHIHTCLQPQPQRFKEVIVFNPNTGESRIIVIPDTAPDTGDDCPDCNSAARSGRWSCDTCGREWS